MAEHRGKPHEGDSDDQPQHRCPICRRAFVGDLDTLPFCSRRCRMVDLGRWFSGSYTISRPMRAEDDEHDFA